MRARIDTDYVADFIKGYAEANGFNPSVRDIAVAFEASTSTIHRHLMILMSEGRLRRVAGQARTWHVAKAN